MTYHDYMLAKVENDRDIVLRSCEGNMTYHETYFDNFRRVGHCFMVSMLTCVSLCK